MKITELANLAQEARVSTEPKELIQVSGTDLPGLLGKGAFNSLIKHPWMSDWHAYKKAWKHGVSRSGFHTVEMYPYMEEVHSVEGGIRPEHKLVFSISHFGPSGKVVQVQKWHRPKEPNEQEKRHGPSAGWKHVKSWKNEKNIDEAEEGTAASKEIRTSLRNAGYKLLGSGADATVWAKKEGPVIKIIMPDDHQGAGVAGDTFMKFYEFCKQNPDLENLPKFSDNEVEVFQADGKDYIMITMERLKPIPRGSFQEAMVWIFSDCASRKMSWRQTKKRIDDIYTWEDNPDFHTASILYAYDKLTPKQLLEYEILYKLMVLLYHKGNINKVSWDLHTENAMMRGNTIVITDPWFNSKNRT